jgi:phytanoyl-CoA hydroxylase
VTKLYRDWATSPELGRTAAAVARREAGTFASTSQLHHDQEPAFSSATGWHQDIRYWSFQKPELVSVWLALGPEHEENGCLWLVPGSHRMEFLPDQFDGDRFFRTDLEQNRSSSMRRLPRSWTKATCFSSTAACCTRRERIARR